MRWDLSTGKFGICGEGGGEVRAEPEKGRAFPPVRGKVWTSFRVRIHWRGSAGRRFLPPSFRPGSAPSMEESSPNGPLPMRCPECGTSVDVAGLPPYAKIECPHCSALIRVRTTMGQYEIVGVLGEGGMSQVFRALDRNLGREVALKILHQSLSQDKALTAMFEREAKLTASIVHPNVVKVFSVGQDLGYFYIAMELLQATSLELLIAKKGALSESEVLGIALEVARGLKAAFDEELIHRDIKPGNILVTDEGTTKLVDFGLALQQGGEDISEDLWATPFYVPPEKLDGVPDTFLGDIYSLGATLYHALAGKPPFDANTPSLEDLKEIKKEAVDLKAVAPGLGKPTVRLVERMMAYRPEDRVQSYDELVTQIEDLRRRQFGVAPTRRPRSKRRRTKLLAAGGGIAAVAIIALALSGRSDPVEEGDLGIGGGERVITVGDSTLAAQFLGAREEFVAGDLGKAAVLFEQLADNTAAPPSTRIWCFFFLGTIRLLEGDVPLSREFFSSARALEPEPDAASPETLGLLRDSAEFLSGPLPLLDEEADFDADSVEAVALLAAGLKNWQAGAFASGARLLGAFAQGTPPASYPWIEPLQKRARPFLRDFSKIRELPNPTGEETRDALGAQAAALREGLSDLRTPGAAPRLVEGRLGRIEEIRRLAAMAPPPLPKDPPPTTAGPSEEELADIAAMKAVLEENRSLVDSLLFSGLAAKFAEVETRTPLGETLRDALARAGADAQRFPDELAAALSEIPWEGQIRRREGRPLDATVTARDAETYIVDLGFGPNEVELGLFAPDWLVEAALDTFEEPPAGDAGPWRALLCFAALVGEFEALGERPEGLDGADEELAQLWSLFGRLR